MPRTKKTNTPNDIKQSNLQETVKWSNPKNYKILKYVHNPQLDELYQNGKLNRIILVLKLIYQNL